MRFKIVAWVLILPVFSFVLAAPVPVREVCEACADGVEGHEGMIIVSQKRALSTIYEGSDSESDTEWAQPSTLSPSATDRASGSHSSLDMPSSSGEVESGTTAEIQPVSPSNTKPISWGPTKELYFHGKDEPRLMPPPEGALEPGTTTENRPASSTDPKSVSWGHTTKVHFYEAEPRPVRKGWEKFLATNAAQQLPPEPKPQSNGFASAFKTFFGKLRNLKFRPRLSRMVDG